MGIGATGFKKNEEMEGGSVLFGDRGVSLVATCLIIISSGAKSLTNKRIEQVGGVYVSQAQKGLIIVDAGGGVYAGGGV